MSQECHLTCPLKNEYRDKRRAFVGQGSVTEQGRAKSSSDREPERRDWAHSL